MLRVPQLLPCDAFEFKLWDPNFRSKDLQQDPFLKDLAAMEVPTFLESLIDGTKEYINFDQIRCVDLDFSANYIGWGMLQIEEELSMTSLGRIPIFWVAR